LIFLARYLSSNSRRVAAIIVVLVAVPLAPIIVFFKPGVKPNTVKLKKSSLPAHPEGTTDGTEIGDSLKEDNVRKLTPLKGLEVTLRRGDTLLKLLLRNGLQAPSANKLIDTLRPYFDPSKLRVGQNVHLLVDGEQKQVRGLQYVSGDMEVRADSTAEGWAAQRNSIPSVQAARVIRGDVDDSLYESGVTAGLSASQIMELSTLFEYDIDFFSDFQRGDDFSVLFEQTQYADGRNEKGEILAAELQAGRQPFRIFHFTNENGTSGYYNAEGKALARAFLRAPLSYQRISSRFSLARRHPIFRVVRPHRAIDYAAPAGTPVVAIGDGRVTFAGWQNGYGNIVEVRHANGFATRYAHFSKIASNIHAGAQVTQGEVVGYVGQTGHATGPHLHFEMLRKGEKIDFLALKIPPAIELRGVDLKKFFEKRDQRLALLEGKAALIAQAHPAKSTDDRASAN
jgi:murein DD-endopeptidase MepM/ murein hydrolase activator NlpD